MRVIYLGKDKPHVIAALRWLVERGHEVVACVGRPGLEQVARNLDIPTCTMGDLRREMPAVDLVISYLYWARLREPLISGPRLGCINFHPAPLPEMRGVAGYSIAILDGMPQWGVSAHFVDPEIDTGDIIEVRRFPIDADTETAWSLEQRSQQVLFDLFTETLIRFEHDVPVPRVPQGPGRYISHADFEQARMIQPSDPPAIIDRKIRAFWYPPFGGAAVQIQGQEYTLVNDTLLRDIAENYRRQVANPESAVTRS